ncbi:hypothetical protein B296_00058095, partial [Ensete ventricosum]
MVADQLCPGAEGGCSGRRQQLKEERQWRIILHSIVLYNHARWSTLCSVQRVVLAAEFLVQIRKKMGSDRQIRKRTGTMIGSRGKATIRERCLMHDSCYLDPNCWNVTFVAEEERGDRGREHSRQRSLEAEIGKVQQSAVQRSSMRSEGKECHQRRRKRNWSCRSRVGQKCHRCSRERRDSLVACARTDGNKIGINFVYEQILADRHAQRNKM